MSDEDVACLVTVDAAKQPARIKCQMPAGMTKEAMLCVALVVLTYVRQFGCTLDEILETEFEQSEPEMLPDLPIPMVIQ